MSKDISWLKMCRAGAEIMVRCSKAQYFAYLIDNDGRVRSCGYNGAPAGMINCTDGGCPRAINNVPSGTTYNYGDGLCVSNHAEMNAIVGVDRKILNESTLYVNGICCFGCAKEITGAGIKKVVGYLPKNKNMPIDYDETSKFFKQANVEWLLYLEEEDIDK